LGAVLLGCAVALGACGGPARRFATPLDARSVDEESYDEVRRRYLLLAPDDPARDAVREHLIAFVASRARGPIEHGEYDAVVRELAAIAELLLPQDLAPGRPIPAAVAPLARWVVQQGSRRGDEPRVLAALLLLSRIEPGESGHVEEYRRVAQWGRQARWDPQPRRASEFFDLASDLVQVWEEHARLSPAPEVLAALADLYVELRDVALGGLLEQHFAAPGRIATSQLRMAQRLAERIPLDVAAVYLRVGDLATAAARVQRLGDRGGIEWRLRRLIEDAAGGGDRGAQALAELAGGFERARSDVAIALCRIGRRTHPNDVRFPLCLARLSAEADRAGEATAWYAEAVELAPDEREVYDEALGHLARMIQAGLFSAETSIGRTRMLARHAERILEQRIARWPSDPPSISIAELHYHVGRAEMHAGNLREAARRLEASLASRRTREALVELALLKVRTGDARAAISLYREALDRIAQQTPDASVQRAELLEHLGDAHRASGDDNEAQRAYRQALQLLRPLADAGDERLRALTRVRIGVLERRIGDRESASDDFRAALDASPGWREPYAEILAHLVVSDPEPALAEEVFRRAQTGVSLGREWRVYFALWVQAIAGRASTPASAEVNRTLTEQASAPGWHGLLASFAQGSLSDEQLLAAAQNPGQRCEAHFYAGARKLAQGDTAAAREQFRRALETGMVGYYEYGMAQELLRALPH
jgi:tetratricopeptide (TPR) repeat protein